MMASRTFIQRCQTVDDWVELSEIFVRSFKQYPLFEHVVPNENNRAEFMKRYFRANYEVHANEGKCVLLSIRKLLGINDTGHRPSQVLLRNDLRAVSKIIGGVFFVGPADDGVGWSQASDEAYWKAYEHHGLHKFDPEAYERLKRYEAWESQYVSNKLFDLRIPMWNGLLCAIDPKHSGNGCGGEIYAACMQAIGQPQYAGKENIVLTRTPESKRTKKQEKLDNSEKSKSMKTSNNGPMTFAKKSREENSRSKNFAIKLLHSMSFLTHHPYHALYSNTASRTMPNVRSSSRRSPKRHINAETNKTENETHNETTVVALSHCPRATQFHVRNGFRCIKTVPYNPDGKPLFNVYVLLNTNSSEDQSQN